MGEEEIKECRQRIAYANGQIARLHTRREVLENEIGEWKASLLLQPEVDADKYLKMIDKNHKALDNVFIRLYSYDKVWIEAIMRLRELGGI